MKAANEEGRRTTALKSFGDMIRRKRQSSRWTHLDLFEKTGIDVVTINAVEHGEDLATASELETICEFLGMPIDTFPKILARSLRAESDAHQEVTNIVELEKHRKPWQKITSHPEA